MRARAGFAVSSTRALFAFAFCRHCSGRDLHIFQLPTMFNTLHLTLACTFTIPLQWFKHLFVEHTQHIIYMARDELYERARAASTSSKCVHAPYFAYHPNRYLVYISLINYMFSFCALRFMLAISSHWFCRFSFFLSFPSCRSCLLFVFSLLHFSLSSCLPIATDLCTLWIFKWAMKKKLMRESVLQMSCVCTTRGIT